MRRLGWIVLGSSLVAMVLAAALFDRRSWREFEGDETTYLMQAESLAWDFDLRYERGDYDRFVAHWGRRPEGLILQSTDGGATLHYGKPVVYSLAIAPFVRLSPTRGASVANALALSLAALAAAAVLARTLGTAGPWWALAFVFGSVAFAYVPWAHADLFLMSLGATGLALASRPRGAEPPSRFEVLAVGLLLGLVTAARPFYAPLLVPAAAGLAAGGAGWGWRKSLPRTALVLGAAALVVAANAGLDLTVRGSASSYGGERLSFDSRTGFPRVDEQSATWKQSVEARGPANWVREGKRSPYRFNARTWAWNSWYFLAGRTVGLLPYYPALLLAVWAFRNDRLSWLLLAAFVAVAAAFFWTRPFNFYGGGGALANRYILPAYPALWFLARRPVRGTSTLVPLAATVVLGLAFLRPVWGHPWGFPLDAQRGYRWVSLLAVRYLPYETTQDHLKPAGRGDFLHGRLWIKPLGPALETQLTPVGASEADQAATMSLAGGTSVDLIAGSPRPLRSLCLVPLAASESTAASPLTLSVRGGIRPFYRVGVEPLRLEPVAPFTRHAMWWTEEDYTLYRLRIEAREASDSKIPIGRRAHFRLAADCEGLP